MTAFSPRRRLLLSSSALILSGSAWPQSREPIVIGHSGPFSGPLASVNKEAMDVAVRYFEQINTRGGLNGRRLVLETLDDAQDPKRAVDNTRSLIEQRRAIALFGYRTSPAIQAALPIITEAKVPFVAAQVGPTSLYQPVNPYVFNIRASYRDEVGKAIEILFSIGFKKIAFLYANDAFGKDVQAGVADEMKRLGGQPAIEVWIENTTASAEKVVDQLWDAQPFAVVLATNNRIAADVIKRFKSKGSRTVQFVTLSNNSSASFLKELEGAGRGVMVTQVLPFPYASMTPVARELRGLMEKFGGKPSYAAMHGLLSAKLLVEGLRRAGNDLSPQGLANALDGATIDLGGFVVDYSRKQRHGSKFVETTTIGNDGSFNR